MTRDELERLIEKHDARADHYYHRYQENGQSIDDRRRRESEDIAEIARIALGMNDIKEERTGLRVMIADWAYRARRGDDLEQIGKEIVSYAENRGLIRREGRA